MDTKEEKKSGGGGVFGFFSRICGTNSKKTLEVEKKTESMDVSQRASQASKSGTGASLRIKTSVKKPKKTSDEEQRIKAMKQETEKELKNGQYLDGS